MPNPRRVLARAARLPMPCRRRAPATRFDWVTPSSGPKPERSVIAKHILVSRDFAGPRELDAYREFFAASLREKAAVHGLRVLGSVSFDVGPRLRRRAAGRDGCRLSRRDLGRWVFVRVWDARHPQLTAHSPAWGAARRRGLKQHRFSYGTISLVSAETGLDSWFLHEKLILGLLNQHETAVLGCQLQLLGPDLSLAQTYRIELFEQAVSAFLARTAIPSLAVSHLHQELRVGQLAWLDQPLSFEPAFRRCGRGLV